MKRKHLKRKSAKNYPGRRENKRELLKTSNETQTPQKKERKKLSPEARKQTRTSESLKRNAKTSKEITQKVIPGKLGGRGGNPILFFIFICAPILQSPITTEKIKMAIWRNRAGGETPTRRSFDGALRPWVTGLPGYWIRAAVNHCQEGPVYHGRKPCMGWLVGLAGRPAS